MKESLLKGVAEPKGRVVHIPVRNGRKVHQEGVSAERGSVCLAHMHVRLISSWQLLASVQAAHVFYKYKGSAHLPAWAGPPPRFHPECWGGSRGSGTILRVQVRPESSQLLWELL